MYQPDLLADKRILVTGGGTGLGRGMVERFIELGAHVTICGRRTEVLENTKAEINARGAKGTVSSVGCDIRDPASVDGMLDEIWASGPLDVLVNNAAGNFISKSEDLSPRAIDAVLNIVAHGTAYVTFGCGKRWLKEGRKATVLSIATTYAETGSAYVVPSAMGKAAMVAMTRSLAVEWGRRGIRLNAVAPGPFPTEGAWERLVPRADLAAMFEAKNPLARPGRHEELADLASYLVSDKSGYINGEVITIDGGEWLQGAGQFNFLSCVTDEEWTSFRTRK